MTMNIKREKERLIFGLKCINFIEAQEKEIEEIVDWIDEHQPVEAIINQNVLALEAIQRAIVKVKNLYNKTKQYGRH